MNNVTNVKSVKRADGGESGEVDLVVHGRRNVAS